MHIGASEKDVTVGDAIYIPPGAMQYIENSGSTDLKFLCIVDPAWRKKDEIVKR